MVHKARGDVVELAPEAAHMRAVLGHVPTSVCVVTTIIGEVPAGSTVGTFTSVSLDPPLIAFFSQHTSETLAAVRSSATFAVNVLAADQSQTCTDFARKLPDRFDRVPWSLGPFGNPHLGGSLAVLECTVEAVTDAGDHVMVLGRVRELDALRSGGEPLVFHGGGLHGLRCAPPDTPFYRTQLND